MELESFVDDMDFFGYMRSLYFSTEHWYSLILYFLERLDHGHNLARGKGVKWNDSFLRGVSDFEGFVGHAGGILFYKIGWKVLIELWS